MTEALIASNLLLWLMVLGLAGVVLALARQIGLLHERSAPLGAMMVDRGPEVGEQAPVFRVTDEEHRELVVGGRADDGRDRLLFFMSPTCPICETLLPTLRAFATHERLVPVLVSDGTAEEHTSFLGKGLIRELYYVRSAELGMRYQIGRVPYAVLIDHEGVIQAKGLVNTREHLESLVEARDTKTASLQEYISRRRGDTRAARAGP